ncbi:Serpin (serine protease inhibitor) [Carpediemonas membranifera]|uniref:Serpin (Serine protease inhibitor) n=1 Tax=Carpediemonas membranifera TaxID=201153 RepID=A0A8J6B016_9EUKA|nr:Serpin (serine protease inhibitor) [Carpediemonas membranifera]|eukprot:KAG9395520.1 Serpin (serine protease inhibitor) [Carpediemonas membranifera]
MNKLTFELAKYAFKEDENMATSGLSLFYTLLLAYTSVEPTSNVARAIEAKLELDDGSLQAFRRLLDSMEKSELLSAAAAFVRDFSSLDKEIATKQDKFLKSEAQPLKSAAQVNQWCADHTNGRIKTILDDLPASSAAVLISALYFKAKWQNAFNSGSTAARPFTLLNGTTVELPTMMQKSHKKIWSTRVSSGFVNFYKAPADGIIALFSLPKQPGPDGLRAALEELVLDRPEKTAGQTQTLLYLPKFKIEQSVVCDPMLKAIGLDPLYRPFQFAAVSTKPDVAVDMTVQKVFLAVDEEGTEAAVVTAMRLRKTAARIDPFETLNFDRPFVFALVDAATGNRILVSTVVYPKYKK